MANVNIPDLTNLTAPAVADELEIYDADAAENKALALSYMVRDTGGTGAIVTGGYTLTLPASGTAALLGTSQAFTANQAIGSGVWWTGPNANAWRETNFGYGAAYKVIQFGDDNTPNRSIALACDPSTNSGGNFSGVGQILIGNSSIMAPNSGDTDWNGVLRHTSDKTYLGGGLSGGELVGNGVVVDTGGLVGMGGITSPTAGLHLPASSTSRASLRIPSGTAPTSPNAGDMWFDGTNLKFRDAGGATRTITWT